MAGAPPARSRAARMAQRVAEEAESWMTPPPGPSDRNRSGRPQRSTSQSRTWISSSVQAGPVDQSIPWVPRPAESSSPSTAGGDELHGK